ncbi:MAG TPA: TetR/AcrR family transcriptional regulator [Spirochaetota bacterium]|nr:TetR/AcrR family transcriptional regulator [Spirochaetota bacterium]HPI89294.1 TetR/AcrR family transcriptional regulator [Spirochaetota bacterium]HPR48531.1 TetR/AcrR family transcriptional regulator [Spirochaetota bacterium]
METDSKQNIINAAIKIIARKGRHGFRMEEIAHEAKINRAMLYYYFSTKENLYLEVLHAIFIHLNRESSSEIREDIEKGKSHEEIITNYIYNTFLKRLNENPEYTRIIMEAIANDDEDLRKTKTVILSTYSRESTVHIVDVIRDGINRGVFRDVDPGQTLVSIIGMILIYFLSPGMIKFFHIEVDQVDDFVENRLNSITDLIMNGIRKR